MKVRIETEREAISKISEAIGARIRTLREAQGLKLASLGELAKIAESTLSRAESGKTNLSIPSLHRIASALGVHAADILNGSDVQRRFAVFGEIGQPVVMVEPSERPQISLPLADAFPDDAFAFKADTGYLVGVPMDESALIDGDQVAFVRFNFAASPSLHVGTFRRSSGLGEEAESSLLNWDAVSAHWMLIQEQGGDAMLNALAEGAPPVEALNETPAGGWLFVRDMGNALALAVSKQYVPFASQIIPEKWRIVAELRTIPPAKAEVPIDTSKPNRLLAGLECVR